MNTPRRILAIEAAELVASTFAENARLRSAWEKLSVDDRERMKRQWSAIFQGILARRR